MPSVDNFSYSFSVLKTSHGPFGHIQWIPGSLWSGEIKYFIITVQKTSEVFGYISTKQHKIVDQYTSLRAVFCCCLTKNFILVDWLYWCISN